MRTTHSRPRPSDHRRSALPLVAFAVLALGSLTSGPAVAVTNYEYLGSVTFADGSAYPYLCAVDANGVLWTISSAAGGLGKTNALYRYKWGDVAPTLVDSYGPADGVASLRGVAVPDGKTDVYVSVATGSATARIFRYTNGALPRQTFDSATNGAGYDRVFYGIDVTPDGYLIGGVTANATGGNGGRIRVLDFSSGASVPGSIVTPECSNSSSATAFELVRDVSLVPGTSGTKFFTSRTAGGVARWDGGTPAAPAGYLAGTNVITWGSLVDRHPFGIHAVADNAFWAAKSDSATGTPGVWVRFYLDTGQVCSDLDNAPGAPGFRSPSDVAPAGEFVYVIDALLRKTLVFGVFGAVEPATWGRIKAIYR